MNDAPVFELVIHCLKTAFEHIEGIVDYQGECLCHERTGKAEEGVVHFWKPLFAEVLEGLVQPEVDEAAHYRAVETSGKALREPSHAVLVVNRLNHVERGNVSIMHFRPYVHSIGKVARTLHHAVGQRASNCHSEYFIFVFPPIVGGTRIGR